MQITLLHSVLLGMFMFFLFSGNRFFYLGDRQVVLVFNCAHLCIICNLEQCLSLVLQIKDCTQSKVEDIHLQSCPYFSATVSQVPVQPLVFFPRYTVIFVNWKHGIMWDRMKPVLAVGYCGHWKALYIVSGQKTSGFFPKTLSLAEASIIIKRLIQMWSFHMHSQLVQDN